MDYSTYRHLAFERRGRILTITLDRPPMNPIHYEMHRELSRVWYPVRSTPSATWWCSPGRARSSAPAATFP